MVICSNLRRLRVLQPKDAKTSRDRISQLERVITLAARFYNFLIYFAALEQLVSPYQATIIKMSLKQGAIHYTKCFFGKNALVRLSIPIPLEILLLILSMYSFHQSFSLIITPRHFKVRGHCQRVLYFCFLFFFSFFF